MVLAKVVEDMLKEYTAGRETKLIRGAARIEMQCTPRTERPKEKQRSESIQGEKDQDAEVDEKACRVWQDKETKKGCGVRSLLVP